MVINSFPTTPLQKSYENPTNVQAFSLLVQNGLLGSPMNCPPKKLLRLSYEYPVTSGEFQHVILVTEGLLEPALDLAAHTHMCVLQKPYDNPTQIKGNCSFSNN